MRWQTNNALPGVQAHRRYPRREPITHGLGLLPLIADKQAKLQRLGLPENEAKNFAIQLAKRKLGIE